MNILPQIAQRAQRNAAGCIISQRKTGLGGFGVSVVLGFVVWVLSAIICENYLYIYIQIAQKVAKKKTVMRKLSHFVL